MNVYKFYNNSGWKKRKSIFEDAKLFEDLRLYSKEYVSKCRKRILNYIPKEGKEILDFASGPIQYNEYLQYSKNFKTRHCVDFSKDAILNAKKRIGRKGKFYCGDFFKIKFNRNYFDCILSLHTIYHIHKSKQKKAIQKLLTISKKGTPIIIVYSNPNTIINRIKTIFFKPKKKRENLYFYCHPISWWKQFKINADVKLYPWRSFASSHQKILFPNNYVGKIMFKILYYLESKFQKFFVNNFQYYIIVLKKN